MMSMFPDRDYDQRRESILQRSPFVRTFIDIPGFELNPERWEREVVEHRTRLWKDLSGHIGENWINLTAVPLLLSAECLEIFNPSLARDSKLSLIISLILAGYEIGTREDSDFMTVDLAIKLGIGGSLHPNCLHSSDGNLKGAGFIETLLATGSYLRGLPLGGDILNSPESEIPNPFKGFIEGLDLTDI